MILFDQCVIKKKYGGKFFKNKVFLLYLVSTKNNVVVTCCTADGNAIFSLSAGRACIMSGLSRSYRKKFESYGNLGMQARNKLVYHNIRNLIVYFKGINRSSLKFKILREILKNKKQFYVHFIGDISSVSHNGCRARKVKRRRFKRRRGRRFPSI